jgi:hypothetical protein
MWARSPDGHGPAGWAAGAASKEHGSGSDRRCCTESLGRCIESDSNSAAWCREEEAMLALHGMQHGAKGACPPYISEVIQCEEKPSPGPC